MPEVFMENFTILALQMFKDFLLIKVNVKHANSVRNEIF